MGPKTEPADSCYKARNLITNGTKQQGAAVFFQLWPSLIKILAFTLKSRDFEYYTDSNNKRSRSEKPIEQYDLFVVGRGADKIEITHFS